MDEKSEACLDEKKLQGAFYYFKSKKNREKIIQKIEEKNQNSSYLCFLDSMTEVLKFYENYRHSKTHRKEPNILLDRESVFPGIMWAKTEKTPTGTVTHWGTGELFTQVRLRGELIRTYEVMTSILRDLFLKLRDDINSELKAKGTIIQDVENK